VCVCVCEREEEEEEGPRLLVCVNCYEANIQDVWTQ